MIGILLGAVGISVLWVCGMAIWCIIADKRDDRRFDIMVRGMDAGRDKALREIGISEEDIARYYTRREEIMNEQTDR